MANRPNTGLLSLCTTQKLGLNDNKYICIEKLRTIGANSIRPT
jgi:hypothetical protein